MLQSKKEKEVIMTKKKPSRWHPQKLCERVTVGISFEAADLEKVKKEAQRQGVSVSELVRRYVYEGLIAERR